MKKHEEEQEEEENQEKNFYSDFGTGQSAAQGRGCFFNGAHMQSASTVLCTQTDAAQTDRAWTAASPLFLVRQCTEREEGTHG